ncbi:hypothetical protein JCGZ_24654 [Jatropha curcas]|uniref:Uncharacterized protein n=1 Tax=Jatropha curcas TaxID=180498 RepID=A0A067L832_JATCU|nr:auxin-responsive protein SAUR40 [Jatropha curcas]KDP40655.1 hypothetical protein JCGZ_24654 [Jatropha curcas]
MGVKASKLSKFINGAKGIKRIGVGSPSTPRGYVPVCVGVSENSSKRFIVHRRAFGDAEFLELLCKSAEEYGFCNEGVLRIPFEAKDFEEWMIRRGKKTISSVKST